MTDYFLRTFPDKFLAYKLRAFDFGSGDVLQTLIPKMFDIMYNHNGIGLAASQVGFNGRVFIMDVPYGAKSRTIKEINESSQIISNEEQKTSSDYLKKLVKEEVKIESDSAVEKKRRPLVCINPLILESKEIITSGEGCLSIPGIYDDVPRYKHVTVQYFDVQQKKITEDLKDLEAICFQHELDHLNGKMFWDLMSSEQKNFLKKEYKKLQAEESKS